MRKLLATAVTLALASVMAVSASAHGTKSAVRTHTLKGTIESYDASAKTLTLKGRTSTSTFEVENAKVVMGSKATDLSDLANETGRKATVKYELENGKKEARSVAIPAEKHSRKASGKENRAARKSGTKY